MVGDLNWLSPINKLIWIKAFKEKRTKVTLPHPDNRKFYLDFDRIPGKVLVKPEDGFAPMGWFDLKECTEKSWLEEEVKDIRVSGVKM